MPLSVPHLKTPDRAIVVYSPSHPAVIFRKIKAGTIRHWNHNRIVRSIHRWLRPPKKKKTNSKLANEKRPPKPSGLILPKPGKSFMLIQSSDAMSDLLAENHRLRNMIDELVRQSDRDRLPHFR